MRNKMITLCPTTYETAKDMPNFSAWVRGKLLEETQSANNKTYEFHYQCPMCKDLTTETIRYARKCVKCDWPLDFIGRLEA